MKHDEETVESCAPAQLPVTATEARDRDSALYDSITERLRRDADSYQIDRALQGHSGHAARSSVIACRRELRDGR